MEPIITIVTVCYNSESTIRRTIESVLEQNLSDIEYLIIDGASTDETLAVVKEYEESFHGKMRVISEKDNGWYDAMNKGIRLAKGQFINFLNSDDYFEQGAIDKIVAYITENKIMSDSVVYGDSTNVYMHSSGEIFNRRIAAPKKISIADKGLLSGMCGIRHQSMFTGAKVFQKVGVLDLKYRLHADWDFLIKCVRQNIPMHYINENLTFYSMYGVSTKPDYRERTAVRKDNGLCGKFDLNYVKDRWGIKVFVKKILGEKRWNDWLFRIHCIVHK